MIALDTNVLVRILTNDDPAQAARALALLRANEVWLPKTVLCETEWVLRDAYDLEASTVSASFRQLVALRNVSVEDAAAVVGALALYEAGLDFADALHLASSAAVEGFRTFDKKLRRKALRLGTRPPVSDV